MRWRDIRRSDNIEDRRGMSIPRGVRIGGAGGLGAVVVLALLAMFFGVDPRLLLGPGVQQQPAPAPTSPGPGTSSSANDELRDFVAAVLGDTEDTWQEVFRKAGKTYPPPKLVLFSQAVESACGFAAAAVGPFYCPSDQKVYVDLSFLEELRTRFGAPGDFAQAYVIAHEVGHHVQTVLGISQRVNEMRSRASPAEANDLSVRLELQADCLAGVWARRAHQARQILETGDIEEGLSAASAIGDDRLQQRARGYVVPESFTHGSSAQRARWFRRGLERGELEPCNTFRVDQP
jgi:predicted metalloprotease